MFPKHATTQQGKNKWLKVMQIQRWKLLEKSSRPPAYPLPLQKEKKKTRMVTCPAECPTSSSSFALSFVRFPSWFLWALQACFCLPSTRRSWKRQIPVATAGGPGGRWCLTGIWLMNVVKCATGSRKLSLLWAGLSAQEGGGWVYS